MGLHLPTVRTLERCFESAGGAEQRGDNFIWLRLVAASLVIYCHSFPLAAAMPGEADLFIQYLGYRSSGDVALHVFFLISGFLVAGSLERNDWKGYALARATRLLPALLVCLLLSAFVMGPLLTRLPQQSYWSSTGPWSYVAENLVLYISNFKLPGVFEENRFAASVNGSIWTLPIEARLYVALGVLGWMRSLSRRSFETVLILVFLGWVLYANRMRLHADVEAARLSVFFSIGALSWFYRRWIPVHGALPLVLALGAWLLRDTPYYGHACGLVLVTGVFWLAYAPRLPEPRWLGDISYGTYLYGWPLMQILAMFQPAMGPGPMTLIVLPLAWLAGAASWHLVESPALERVKAWRRKRGTTHVDGSVAPAERPTPAA